MSGPKHTPTPARDVALRKAWAEHPELGNEERSAFICGFEAGWNAATPRRARAGEGRRAASERVAEWRRRVEKFLRDRNVAVDPAIFDNMYRPGPVADEGKWPMKMDELVAELVEALKAWQEWAARYQADIYFSGLSEEAYEALDRLVMASADVLARVKG